MNKNKKKNWVIVISVIAALFVFTGFCLYKINVPKHPDIPAAAATGSSEISMEYPHTVSSQDPKSTEEQQENGTIVTGGDQKNDGIHTENEQQKRQEMENIMKRISEETAGE